MYIIVGLGNPSKQYEGTRHNAGFMTLDVLADRYNIDTVSYTHLAGAPIGMAVLYFISGAVRKSTTYTIPELFELRYGAGARDLAAVCIILAYVGTTASQFKAAGNIFMITSGVDFVTSTVICVVFMALLALIGGMVSVAYTLSLIHIYPDRDFRKAVDSGGEHADSAGAFRDA